MQRFVHLFETQSELDAAYESSGYTEPWLACVFSAGEYGSGISYNKKTQFNGHDYVDLGLTSGTLWATCNVGASSPEEVGDYFAFGETKAKSTYSPGNYRYYDQTKGELTKYNESDYKHYLDITDDAANAAMGGDWVTPTCDAFYELFQSTNTGETTLNGVSGIGFTSKTDSSKSIFIPYNGYKEYDALVTTGDTGFLLLCNELNSDQWYSIVYTKYGGPIVSNYNRYIGFPVRGIVSLTLDLSNYQYPRYGEAAIEISFDEVKQPGTYVTTYIREPDGKIHCYNYSSGSSCWRSLSKPERRKLGAEVLRFYLTPTIIYWDLCNERDLGFGGD